MKINKTAIFVFLGAIALGTGIFLNLNQIITLVQQKASPLINMIQPGITQFQTIINQIPSEWRTFLLISSPVAIVGFIVNWWRTRQMNQLSEQSLAKIQELSTANLTANTTVSQLRQQIEQTPKSIDLSGTVTTLSDKLGESQQAYDQVWEQLQQSQRDLGNLQRIANPKYVRALEETLRIHNIPLPTYDGSIITQVR